MRDRGSAPRAPHAVALIDQRVVEHLGPLKEAFVEFLAGEVEPLRAENVALRQRCAELESRIDTVRDHASQHVDARIEAEVAKHFVAGGPLSRAIDEGWQRRRADDREHVVSLVDAAKRELETKLGDLEQRVASHPGKLPMARAFVAGRVNYAGDIVVCEGSTYQATRDTAAAPSHVDWVCLARAGRDAQSPRMRGAFDSKLQYRALDVVEFDKASYIARRDDPGPIFGDGWQALAPRGKTGDKGPSGPRGERGESGEKGERGEIGLVGPPGPCGEKGERGTSGRDGIAGARGEKGEKGEKGEVGPAGERGAEGPPGRLSVVKVFEPGRVHYQGDVVTHGGSLYQAVCDTARGIPHEDWVCLARAGRDAVSPDVRGTYDAHERYNRLDIVAIDGATFIARCDDPGICPGEGWQLMSRHGKPGRRGENGERGLRGERGDKGERGEPRTAIVDWLIDRENYRASPRMSDGTVGPMLELRELFEQFQWETS